MQYLLLTTFMCCTWFGWSFLLTLSREQLHKLQYCENSHLTFNSGLALTGTCYFWPSVNKLPTKKSKNVTNTWCTTLATAVWFVFKIWPLRRQGKRNAATCCSNINEGQERTTIWSQKNSKHIIRLFQQGRPVSFDTHTLVTHWGFKKTCKTAKVKFKHHRSYPKTFKVVT